MITTEREVRRSGSEVYGRLLNGERSTSPQLLLAERGVLILRPSTVGSVRIQPHARKRHREGIEVRAPLPAWPPHGAIIVNTNLPFSEWTQVLQTERLVVARLDRIMHSAHIPEMSGESYRLKSANKRRAKTREEK